MSNSRWTSISKFETHSITFDLLYIWDRIVENVRKDSSVFSLAQFADTLIKGKWYYMEEFWNV